MADDLGALYADKKVATLEKKLNSVYKQAQKDIKQKTETFFAKAAKKDKVMQAKLSAGKITQDEYDHWKSGKIFMGENWKSQQENIAKVLANANSIATAMINGEKADVFAFNGNYEAYQFEHGFGVSFGFDLYSEKSVERLLRDNPKLLPPKKLDKSKDIPWNMRNIRTQVTQGIIQGESIPKIAQRLADVVPNRNKEQMILHARTAMTSAQNGGRMERYKEAEALGIKFKKVWIATLDSRTRDRHQDLDGTAIKPDDYFDSGDYRLLFPGDPNGHPSTVYNCRCTLGTELDDYPSSFVRRAYDIVQDENGIPHRQSHLIQNMTYKQWVQAKTAGAVVQPVQPQPIGQPESEPQILRELSNIKATMSDADYERYYKLVQGNEYVEGLYNDYENDVSVKFVKGGGVYRKWGGIEYGFENEDRYSTLAHEFGHAFDDKARGDFNVTYNEIDRLNKAISDARGFKYEPFKRSPSQSDEYLEAIRKDREILREAIKSEVIRGEFNKDDLSAGVQDLCDGLFGTQDSKNFHLRWGHGNKYYNRKYNNNISGVAEKEVKELYMDMGFDASNQAKVKNLTRIYEASSELWANQVSALTTRSEALDYMEYYCPNSLAVIKRLLKERNNGIR